MFLSLSLSFFVRAEHNVDFEGVAGAVKFAEFMKRKAKKKIENQEKTQMRYTRQPSKSKM